MVWRDSGLSVRRRGQQTAWSLYAGAKRIYKIVHFYCSSKRALRARDGVVRLRVGLACQQHRTPGIYSVRWPRHVRFIRSARCRCPVEGPSTTNGVVGARYWRASRRPSGCNQERERGRHVPMRAQGASTSEVNSGDDRRRTHAVASYCTFVRVCARACA